MSAHPLAAACAMLLAMPAPVAAGPAPAADVAALRARIERILAREGVPGAGVALAAADGRRWSFGVGLADVASGRPATADTAFRLGSVTKAFTALALVRLAEQGGPPLDAPLARAAPDVAFQNPWEATRPVTLAHLLEHTAGWEFLRFNEWMDDRLPPRSIADALAVNPASRRSRWPPGERSCYSNGGYQAAGRVLERATGLDYDAAMQRLVLDPLGMADTAFRLTPALAGRLATGYDAGGRPYRYEEDMMRPAAGLLATPRDLAAWAGLFAGRGELDGRRLLSPGALARVEAGRTLPWDGPDDRYGLGNEGWEGLGFAGRGHRGWTFGYQAAFHYLPEERVGWVVVLNREGREAALQAVEEEVARFLVGGRAPPPPVPEVILPAAELEALAGFYRDVTPADGLRAAVVGLGGARLEARGGRLWLRDCAVVDAGSLLRGLTGCRGASPLVALGGGAFRAPEGARSSWRVVARPGGGQALVNGLGGYLERGPAWPVVLGRALLGLALLGLLLAAAVAPLAPWRWGGGGAAVAAWLGPAIAAACAALAYAVARWSPQLLGRLNASSLSICALGWLFGAAAAAALAGAAALTRAPAPLASRLGAAWAALAAGGLAAWAWRVGVLGIRTWRW